MNELKIFESQEFGQVRTVVLNEESMFCLMDICKALEISNPTMTASRLEEDEVTKLDLGGRVGETNFITESGLYAVILRSDKPKAREFRKWVTSEVLPSIRQTGIYQKPTSAIGQLQLQQQAILEVNEKVDEVKQDLENFKQSVPLYACDMDKIDKINQILLNRNIGSVDYWTEGTYKDSTGRKLREYQVTKKGCELIARKTEGEKGILFTVKYMERFELMEQLINKPKSVIDLIELELKAIKEVDSKVDSAKQDLEEFKKSVPLYACDIDKITIVVYWTIRTLI